jgi:hypothetical protein
MRAILTLLTGALLWVAASCSSPTESGGLRPGLNLSLEAGTTDTVNAPPARIVVTARDSAGGAIPSARVEFQLPDPSDPVAIEVFRVRRMDGRSESGLFAADATDESGVVAAQIFRGIRAGDAKLLVTLRSRVPPYAIVFRDSAMIHTSPGRPAGVAIAPRDTVLYQGNTGVFFAGAVDRFGNPRPELAVLEGGTPGVTVQGTTVRAVAGPSRQLLRARLGSVVDSAWLSIVPRGVILARNTRFTTPDVDWVFAVFQLDGSDYRRLVRAGPPDNFGWNDKDLSPTWVPDGSLVFSDGPPWNRTLYRVATTGTVAPLLPSNVTSIDMWPQVASDGSWVYFEGAEPNTAPTLYRARLDGSAAERISLGPLPSAHQDLYPSPSPDGRYVAFTTDRELSTNNGFRLQILDLVTRTILSPHVDGVGPRWSPTGEWIALGNQDALYLVRPDGSGLRRVSEPEQSYWPWASWSPDGQWLVVENKGEWLDLIEVATGLRLPLRYTQKLTTPAWRPQ